MILPNLLQEKKLWERGYKVVACIDEVGRGPLAGPVVACAVVITNSKQIQNSGNLKLRDSKQLSQKQREQFYEILTTHKGVWWGIGKVSAKVIDRINIFQATKLAMKRAVKNLAEKLLEQKYSNSYDRRKRRKRSTVDFLILDGNMTIDMPISQKSIVKGDEKVFSCAVASIIAKVKRDRAMVRYHKKYPHYGFAQHKGYGTRLHFAAIRKHGPCPLHRKSFL